jgi:GH24 family phage-related lysozyme (muramidase)
MTINYGSLGMSYLDPSQLPAMLTLEESNIPVPYADSVGIATIAIGVNLTVLGNMALVLDQLGVFSTYIGQLNATRQAAGSAPLTTAESKIIYQDIVNDFESVIKSNSIMHDSQAGTGNSTSEQALQDALNSKLQDYGVTSQFQIDTNQATTITNEIILGYSIGPYVSNGMQSDLDQLLIKGGVSSISHDSPEYEALMSMFYNSTPTYSKTSGQIVKDNLIGPKLLNALATGNRAEAWYQIRYQTNSAGWNEINQGLTPNALGGAGLAKRRYIESQMFGLYDNPNSVSTAEAVSVYQMLQQHRNDILSYEAEYGVNPDGTLGNRDMIAAANHNYWGRSPIENIHHPSPVSPMQRKRNHIDVELTARFSSI